MNWRKTISGCLAVLMLAGCSGKSASSSGTYTPGTYEGTGNGRNGEVKVSVTVSADKIEKIEVTEQQETKGVADNALANMPGKIVDAQSTDVDGKTGATLTSNAIKEAVDNALAKAKGDNTASEEKINTSADVIVVGAGGAGLMAGFSAINEGASVIILEASSAAGGDTAASGGNFLYVNDEYNASQDRNDDSLAKYDKISADQFEEPVKTDFLTLKQQIEEYRNNGQEKGAFGSVEQVIVDQYLNGIGKDLDGNVSHLNYDIVRKSAEENQEIYQILKDGGMEIKDKLYKANVASPKTRGSGMIDSLMKQYASLGEIVYNMRATDLVEENGKVTGVKAADQNGKEVTFNAAKAVVLASGGFAANSEKCAELQKYGKYLSTENLSTNASTLQGDGIWMAQAIGAKTQDMQFLWSVLCGDKNSASLAEQGTLLKAAQLTVNIEGRRYYDETRSMPFQKATNEQTGTYSFFVGDKKMIDALNANKEGTYEAFKERDGLVFEGETLEEAARAAGVDAEALKATVESFNQAVDAGSDAETGRTQFNGKVEEGPFVITKMRMDYHLTFGGLVTDAQAHVLDENDQPIKGLYAAGDVTTGYEGVTHQSGNCLSAVLTMGREAGRNAAAE